MKETDHQTQIKLSVIRQGGYSFKLSNRFTIGIPDLLIALPPFVPCLAEVKDLGECGRTFSRQLSVSPKQKHELASINRPYNGATVGILLVVLRWAPAGQVIVPLDYRTDRLSDDMLEGRAFMRRPGHSGQPPWYDMEEVLRRAGVARMQS